MGFFLLLFTESTDDAGTGEVLTGDAQHLVQLVLYFFVHGHSDVHNAKDHDGQNGNHHNKKQGCFYIDGKRHNHGTKHDKGRTQKQAQGHVDTGLYLVHIAGHAGNHGRGTQCIHLGKGKALHVFKQGRFHRGSKAGCRFCGKILGSQGTGQSDDAKQHQHSTHFPDIGNVPVTDTLVNDCCHDKRHKEFKGSFQHLKQRSKDSFFFVSGHVPHKFFHAISSIFFLHRITFLRSKTTGVLLLREQCFYASIQITIKGSCFATP